LKGIWVLQEGPPNWVPVAQACNPNYSGGRDQVQNQPQANSSWDPIMKIPITKQGWWNGSSCRAPAKQGWGPEFTPQYSQKKKKKTTQNRFCLVEENCLLP
jgi:hypothetical protein